MRTALLLLILFATAPRVGGARYYFSAAGNDVANGLTPATAWQTVAKMYSITPGPGDSLLFRAGDVFNGMVYLGPASQGTAAKPIVIASYGAGRAVLAAGTGAGIFCYNNGNITIRNLTITGAGDSINGASGIFCYADTPGGAALPNIRIDSVDVSGFGNAGIEVYAYPKDTGRSGYRGLRITHAAAHANGNVGIMVWGKFKTSDTAYNHTGIYIGHCAAYNNRGIGGGINGSGIEVSQADSAMIEYCTAYNNGTTGGGGVGIWAWDANRVFIQHCESHHNHTTRSDGDGFDLDGGVTNSVMQYNYAHDNDGAGYLLWQFDYARPFGHNTVRYNISENDSRTQGGYYGCVAIGMGDTSVNSGIHNVDIYNNTFYKTRIAGGDSAQGPAVSLDGRNITGIRICNNIFVLDSTRRFVYDYHGAGVTFLNNDYWSRAGFWVTVGSRHFYSAPAWSSATGAEVSGGRLMAKLSSPVLLAPGRGGTIGNADSLRRLLLSYGLTKGAPMIDSGISVSGVFGINPGTMDVAGNATPAGKGYDIGACEYQPPAGTYIMPLAGLQHYTISPLPFSKYFDIAGAGAGVAVSICDMSGRLVLQRRGIGRIDAEQWMPGIYVLRISGAAGSEQRLIIKQ